MRFSELLTDIRRHGLESRVLSGRDNDPVILSLSQDSRRQNLSGLFVAIKGAHHDAHEMLEAAAANGTRAFLVEREVEVPVGCAAAIVKDTRLGVALAASALHGHPSDTMTVIGITGTDGKTTASILTVEALLGCGVVAGGLTSLDFRIGGAIERNSTYMTTLEANDIQGRLHELRDAGVKVVTLETTSHGIAQRRVAGIEYDVAAYTNLTHEHLDFHGTLEQYRQAKLELARMAWQSRRKPDVPKALVYKSDEGAWKELRHAPADRRVSYGLAPDADVRADELSVSAAGMSFALRANGQQAQVKLPLLGRFNVENALCALAICHALGQSLDGAVRGIERARGLRGRMQVVNLGQPFTLVVDYAHTPDGLEKVLTELRPLTPGRLLALFGAPGDRDPSKRPLMGQAVARLADHFVITSDDPRQERAEDICAALAAGAEAAGRRVGEDFQVVIDRRQAIRAVLKDAERGDTVLLAGKGHEDRMLVGAEALPWDEVEEASAALRELGLSGA